MKLLPEYRRELPIADVTSRDDATRPRVGRTMYAIASAFALGVSDVELSDATTSNSGSCVRIRR